MNHPAYLFKTLTSAWHQDAASTTVDSLAAELAAHVGRSSSELCLGIIKREAVQSFYGLVFLLDQYGLILRKRYREQGDAAFVFIGRRQEVASEFAGVRVVARQAYPAALPKAA